MPGRNSRFYDLTFLYPRYYESGSINHSDEQAYHDRIRAELANNPGRYRDGDILFIGSTYSTRQEYGFAKVINNGTDFIQREYPLLDTPGVYYKSVIDEINDFWTAFEGQPYYDFEEDQDYIDRLKSENRYYSPSDRWKEILPEVKKESRKMVRNRVYLEDLGLIRDISDKIARQTVLFGKQQSGDVKYLKTLAGSCARKKSCKLKQSTR
jgi:hypothetical protein